ncbi:adenylate kinase [Cecembia calidifontis]|uniref:Adenylate kinase n=2 Tax=Cecembia calidifontis TaxID=1187080 RepID=A0A4Q7P4J6_9BACT|nr:adenylate kinase [Cecembia calidifontis]
MIRIKDKIFTPYLDRTVIENRVKELGKQLSEDYKDKDPIIIGVLNGSFMFLSDLVKHIQIPAEISFLKIASYQGETSTGKVKNLIGLDAELKGRHVILVEDIVDTGLSMVHLLNLINEKQPLSVKIVTLLHKPEALKHPVKIDYLGFEIPNKFVVGYGLDYDGFGRNIPEIYQLKINSDQHISKNQIKRKMLNIVLFGPPGAGKGTQSEKIIAKYNLTHLSTGDLFRKHLGEGTELGKLARKYMDEGKLVPDEVVIDMVDDKIANTPETNGFIFDGFPRTVAQAEALDKLMQRKGTQIAGMIALDVAEEVLKERIRERGKTSGRVDDQDEAKIETRIKVYLDETLPVADYYDKQGKLTKINGVGSIDGIFQEISNVIDSY